MGWLCDLAHNASRVSGMTPLLRLCSSAGCSKSLAHTWWISVSCVAGKDHNSEAQPTALAGRESLVSGGSVFSNQASLGRFLAYFVLADIPSLLFLSSSPTSLEAFHHGSSPSTLSHVLPCPPSLEPAPGGMINFLPLYYL